MGSVYISGERKTVCEQGDSDRSVASYLRSRGAVFIFSAQQMEKEACVGFSGFNGSLLRFGILCGIFSGENVGRQVVGL